MNQGQKNVADVEVILEGIVAHSKMTIEAQREEYGKDPFFYFYRLTLPGDREMLIGSQGDQRLWDVAERFFLSRKREREETDIDSFVAAVGEEIAKAFIVEGREVSEGNISKALASAFKKVALNYRSITHYIPCSMISSAKAGRFVFGPVEFIPTNEFCFSYEAELEALPQLAATDLNVEPEKLEEFIAGESQRIRELLKFFRQFGWVAQITIGPCAESVSRRRAHQGLAGALNALKLLFGPQNADGFRSGEDSGPPRNTFRLSRIEDNRLQVGSWYKFPGNAFGEDWKSFLEETAEFYSGILQVFLTKSVMFEELPPLCDRFLSALSWYGDAVSEPQAGAKIVKFVSAIESLVGTGQEKNQDGTEKRGVSDMVAKRAAIFYAKGSGLDLEAAIAEVRKIYSIRSELVHGSIQPSHKTLPGFANRAGVVARWALLVGADYYDRQNLETKISLKELRKRFESLEAAGLGDPNAAAAQDDGEPAV